MANVKQISMSVNRNFGILLLTACAAGMSSPGTDAAYPSVQVDSTTFDLVEKWNLNADYQNGIWTSSEAVGKNLASMAIGPDGDLYFAAAEEYGYHNLLRRSADNGSELGTVSVDWGSYDHSDFATSFVLNDTQGNLCVSATAAGRDYPLTIAALTPGNAASMQVIGVYTLPIEDSWYVFTPVSVYGDVSTGNFSAMASVWTRSGGAYTKETVVCWVVQSGSVTERNEDSLRCSAAHIQMLDSSTALVHDRNADAADFFDETAVTAPAVIKWDNGRMSVASTYPISTADTYGSAALLIDGLCDRPLMIFADSGIKTRFRCVALSPVESNIFGGRETSMWTFPASSVGHVASMTDLSALNHYDRMSLHCTGAPTSAPQARAAANTGDITLYTFVHRSSLGAYTLKYRPAEITSVGNVSMTQDGTGFIQNGNTLSALTPLTIHDLSGRIVAEARAGETVTLKTGSFYIVRSTTGAYKIFI